MQERTAAGLAMAATAALIIAPDFAPDLPRFDAARRSEALGFRY